MKTLAGISRGLLLAGAIWTTPAGAADSSRAYLVDRASGVSAVPIESIPDRSLRSESSRTVLRQGIRSLPPRAAIVGGGYGGAVVVEGDRGFQHNFGFPDDYNRTRRYYAYPSVVVEPPTVVTKETTIVQPKTEYDTYGIGNTVKVQRVYTTTERESIAPPVVYDVHVQRRGHDGPLYGHSRGSGVVSIVTRGERTVETEKRMETVAAERASLPGADYVRMAGSNGKVYLISRSNLEPQGSPSRGTLDDRTPGFGWTPRKMPVE